MRRVYKKRLNRKKERIGLLDKEIVTFNYEESMNSYKVTWSLLMLYSHHDKHKIYFSRNLQT